MILIAKKDYVFFGNENMVFPGRVKNARLFWLFATLFVYLHT